jgi:hypothetical protein
MSRSSSSFVTTAFKLPCTIVSVLVGANRSFAKRAIGLDCRVSIIEPPVIWVVD